MGSNFNFRGRSTTMLMSLSILVILGGMGSAIFIGAIAAPDPHLAVASAIAIFGAIALVPLAGFFATGRERKIKDPNDETFWEWAKRTAFRRAKPKRLPPKKFWKRKATDFVSTPHGAEFVPFIPERKTRSDDDSPFLPPANG